MRALIPNLWCDDRIQEQVDFYVGLFPDSRVTGRQYYGPDSPGTEGDIMYLEFDLLGQAYGAIHGGSQFPYTEAISFEVPCETQAEVDRVWAALCDGGEPGPCGWVKDRYGVSWQVNPTVMQEMMHRGDDAAAERAMQYMFTLQGEPWDIEALQAAYDGA